LFFAQAHTCDKTCKLPCANGAGHRRWLAEIAGEGSSISLIVPIAEINPPTCPLELYASRVEETTAACCPDARCPAGE
jgi:hypothetical protein